MGVVCCREELLDLEGEVDLSHFTLLRSVGKGAFGKVRVVQHKGSKQLYALKYINKSKCINMRAVENIISERRLLEQIDFNLIVNMRYAFQDDENLFMVLDLMLGGDLRFHLDRLGTMPEDYVRFYAAEVALSLNYLHSLNIIHRDLKPDNILLDEQGHAHLTDFNIATVVNNAKPLTSVAGSFAYIAPEILLKRGYLASVDWWSMGIVLYELLFGKRPFRGKTNDALQQAILHDNLHFPENHKVSPFAIDFIRSLLTRDVKSRIGVGKQGFQRLVNHPWFSNIPWERLEKKHAEPPFVPDSKRANFDPTHELEEILLEDNPLKVKKRNPKKSGAANSYANSLKSSITDPNVVEQSPERQMMDEKFITYDYTKPYENENRKKMIEQKYWAQRMNKTTSEKQDSNNRRKAAATYKTSVLDYLNQKPATPLSAGDILKLEELARSARSGAVKDKGAEWRPPSGLIGSGLAGTSQINDIQARDEFILQNGGIPPPSRPPPIVSHYGQSHNKDSIITHSTYDTITTNNTATNTTNNRNIQLDNNNNNYSKEYTQQQQSYQTTSDSSYRLASSPDNSEYPLISSTAAISIENLQQPQQQQPQQQPNYPTNDLSYLYAASTISTASSQTLHDSNKSIHNSSRPPPVRMSSIPRFHGSPLPPPTSLPPPIPTELPPLPPVPKDYL